MKKYRLKLSTIDFRFLQSVLLKLAEAYKYQLPEHIEHQLLMELYDSKFNVSVVEQDLQKTMILPRSVVMALHTLLKEIPLNGEANIIRNNMFNDLDVFLDTL
ncbi:hypothetical protein [Flammeovirga kamogawensis]|uniref:Uncharacterized protein n=1 Tax=Flammeovirga kamogawensis TaxID=373891 RepID=A0ABX8GY42_9BACT|nr:hypothetical protein [Flammeovirga kamogawensis]MBB6460907.1 hypothetical protein [Flammeovirga kamogawensis]QWG08252.1 hypothetical protein KM029_04755 [Flammeovirga kamogawensis]TRX70055.1 hypothetical protein EO216_18690 [Flammeovirga kamogawensis]